MEELPDEILEVILKYVPEYDRVDMRAVCKRWDKIINGTWFRLEPGLGGSKPFPRAVLTNIIMQGRIMTIKIYVLPVPIAYYIKIVTNYPAKYAKKLSKVLSRITYKTGVGSLEEYDPDVEYDSEEYPFASSHNYNGYIDYNYAIFGGYTLYCGKILENLIISANRESIVPYDDIDIFDNDISMSNMAEDIFEKRKIKFLGEKMSLHYLMTHLALLGLWDLFEFAYCLDLYKRYKGSGYRGLVYGIEHVHKSKCRSTTEKFDKCRDVIDWHIPTFECYEPTITCIFGGEFFEDGDTENTINPFLSLSDDIVDIWNKYGILKDFPMILIPNKSFDEGVELPILHS